MPGAERVADDQRDLGDRAVADGAHQLRPAADDPRPLGVAADVEAVDVLDEQDRQPALVAVEHEPRGLVGAVGVDHAAELERAAPSGRNRSRWLATIPSAIPPSRPKPQTSVRPNSARYSSNRPPSSRRRAGRARRTGPRVRSGRRDRGRRPAGPAARSSASATRAAGSGGQERDQPAQAGEAGVVVGLAIVDRAADGRVDVGAAELLVRDLLADRRLHQRRARRGRGPSPRSSAPCRRGPAGRRRPRRSSP